MMEGAREAFVKHVAEIIRDIQGRHGRRGNFGTKNLLTRLNEAVGAAQQLGVVGDFVRITEEEKRALAKDLVAMVELGMLPQIAERLVNELQARNVSADIADEIRRQFVPQPETQTAAQPPPQV